MSARKCGHSDGFRASISGYWATVRVLLPVFVLLLVVLFFVGVFAPRRSRRLQGWIDDRMERQEEQGDRSHGRLGNWTAKALDFIQRATDAALRGGRKVRGKAES